MTFLKTKLAGVFEIHLDRHVDARGFFARSWCRKEWESNGLNPTLAQCSVSFNPHQGTLRGIHYQAVPCPETKLVRCTRGAIYDVVVDLRSGSPTFKEWTAAELTADNRHMVYIPEGCGHGFLTLSDESEVCYQISEFYHPELARGVRWDDPAFHIVWPRPVRVISERDRTYANLDELRWAC
jgi:dTDP-4-dehydrorhamnose 3,5-epimerase